ELEVPRAIEHLLFEFLHFARQLLLAHRLVARGILRGLALANLGLVVVYAFDDVLDALGHAAGSDAAVVVVTFLLAGPALGLVDGAAHGVRHAIRIEYGRAVDVARRPAYGLYERALGAQKALLVGVEYRDERHLRQVQPFAQQVDAYQDV